MPHAALVLLPILGAFLAHAPVLRFNLLPGWARPLDAGRTWRGRRLLGDNKTWRGLIVMWSGVFIATLALSTIAGWWSALPGPIQAAGPLPYATLLALGAVTAELPNSFAKRQLDIAPGRQRGSLLGVLLSLLDQGDFVLGCWLTLAPIWLMTVSEAATAFSVVAAVHLVVNVIGWAIGARQTWI